MRLATLAATAMLAVGGVAIAQVAVGPDEDKLSPQNGATYGNILSNDADRATTPSQPGDNAVVEDGLANDTVVNSADR